MLSKHAYLIIAHDEFDLLEKLIVLLDHPRNDIYLHIDKKVKDFDFAHFKGLVNQSTIYFTDRIDVRWGDFTQIQCENILLKAAVPKNYAYYHLLSGVDLPLISQDQIHAFFDQYQGKEFLHFFSDEATKTIENRVLHYHLPRLYRLKHLTIVSRFIKKLLAVTQNALHIRRKWDEDVAIRYGANWFSITDDLAKYVVSKEDWVNEHFHHTFCADELYLQTIVYNSKFKDALYDKSYSNDYHSCMRYIDWTRGKPYTFRSTDYEELINSFGLFARKFSSKIDNNIVNRIFEHVQKLQKSNENY